MLIYQISLHDKAYDAREKTWEQCIEETGCKPNQEWRDPLTNNPLRLGEFGCSVSHLRVWEKIATSKQAGLVLEEDALFYGIDTRQLEELIQNYDSLWLGWRENSLGYWYNAHAYVVSCETAERIIEGFSDAIIPVDEWLPLKLKDSRNYFFPEGYVKQIHRQTRPSTIEGTQMLTDSQQRLHVGTVATDPSKMTILQNSVNYFGIGLKNLGFGVDWSDTMEGIGGLPKIHLVREHLESLDDNDIFLFVDGYDTFFADNLQTIKERFLGFGCDVLFGAESTLWPQPDIQTADQRWKPSQTPYKYLNSGLYIGYVWALKSFFLKEVEPPNHWDDDQRYCQLRFLDDTQVPNVALDYEGYIFQNHEPEVRMLGRQIHNPITQCCGCIYHGNGGADAKAKYKALATEFDFYEAEVFFNPTLEYKEIAPNILVTDFLSEEYCKELIERSEKEGGWNNMEGDAFPAKEIRLKKLGLWDDFEMAWKTKLGTIAENFWTPMKHYGLRDAFTMRYSMDTQRDLPLHTDASQVTGSVKLNDQYEGAELIWPHQEFDNKEIKIGQCLLFPSMVTHGHKVQPLTSGVKYSLTMWTKRFSGDG